VNLKKRGAGAPYRGAAPGFDAAPLEDSGLVADLIRQFADPLAFYRELVQNAIDAGATEILVQLFGEKIDETHATVRVSVHDDGSGMTRQTLEEELTVLFRSTKESRDDAIGKFGVGFVSVLAVAPEVVIVDTSIGDHVRWSLHLHPDRTYDLYRTDGVPAAKGTTVTLHVPLPASELRSFVSRSEEALRRWCRHARIPIRFRALESGSQEPLRDVRIDEPLGLDALVTVQALSRDGRTHAIVGLPRSGGRVGAFYNQGLLLHESRDHELGAIAFKVLDPRLEHTLSRDNVRRDEHYARAVELVRRAIEGPLQDAIVRELRQLAEAHARGAAEAGARYLEIVRAVREAELELDPADIAVPVIPGRNGALVRTLAGLKAAYLSPEGRSSLAEALARRGTVVIDGSMARDDDTLVDFLTVSLRVQVTSISDAFVWIDPVPLDARDRRLLERVAALLGEAYRKPSQIVLAHLEGAHRDALAIAGGTRGEPWVVGVEAASADPLRLLARPPLVLRAEHPIVAAARARFSSAPVLASGLLARAILVSLRRSSDRVLEKLTAAGLRAALAPEGRE
jgi:molecular chaperone HtpG